MRAVIISKAKGKWVFCKHKERDTYGFHLGGDGDNAGEFENEGFVGQKIQSGKPILFGKSGCYLAKEILHDESEKLLNQSSAHVILIEINRERNQFKMPDF